MNADLLDLEVEDEKIDNFSRSQHISFIHRVIRVLKAGLEKLTIALIVPSILKHPECLKICLSEDEFNEFMEICTKYFPPNCENMNVEYDKIVDLRIIDIIQMLYTNKAFKEHIPKYVDSLTGSDKDIIDSFADLVKISEIRLPMSASFEIIREKVIHSFYLSNEEIKEKIKSKLL